MTEVLLSLLYIHFTKIIFQTARFILSANKARSALLCSFLLTSHHDNKYILRSGGRAPVIDSTLIRELLLSKVEKVNPIIHSIKYTFSGKGDGG